MSADILPFNIWDLGRPFQRCVGCHMLTPAIDFRPRETLFFCDNLITFELIWFQLFACVISAQAPIFSIGFVNKKMKFGGLSLNRNVYWISYQDRGCSGQPIRLKEALANHVEPDPSWPRPTGRDPVGSAQCQSADSFCPSFRRLFHDEASLTAT